MLSVGTLVSLNYDKAFTQNEEEVLITAGSTGTIAQVSRQRAGEEQLYVVYFGAMGQCYCSDNEITVLSAPTNTVEQTIRILNRATERVEAAMRNNEPPTLQLHTDEEAHHNDDTKIIDVEADIARRMAELERESA